MSSVLKIEFKNTKPVEISDFAASLTAIGNLYSSFAIKNGRTGEEAKARLVVEKVQEGSILIYLQAALTEMLPMFGDANMLVEFMRNLSAIKDWFLYGRGKEPDMSVNDCRDMRDMYSLVSNDNGSIMNIGVIENGERVIYNDFSVNFYDGTQMKAKTSALMAEKREVTQADAHRNQVMKIYQLRSDSGSEAGNKAIIDELYPGRKMKVWFNTPELKSAILYSDDNPTQMGFLVDVIVKTIEDKPIGYLVTELHDSFRLEE